MFFVREKILYNELVVKKTSIKKKKEKIVVVMPAYNAEKTLKKTLADIPNDIVDKIILVDDGSNDKTVILARKLKLKTFVHPQNRGYGGNQKTCYTLAMNENADIIVMIHPDYQYDSSLIGEIIRPIQQGRFEIVLGSRIRSRSEALAGGMPRYKYFFNRFLTIMQNIVLDQNLSEYHTGFRAFRADTLKTLPFHKFSDDFVFDQDILISAIYSQFKIGEIQVPVRYFPDASSINFRRSLKYGVQIIWDLFLFVLTRKKLFHSKIFGKHEGKN